MLTAARPSAPARFSLPDDFFRSTGRTVSGNCSNFIAVIIANFMQNVNVTAKASQGDKIG